MNVYLPDLWEGEKFLWVQYCRTNQSLFARFCERERRLFLAQFEVWSVGAVRTRWTNSVDWGWDRQVVFVINNEHFNSFSVVLLYTLYTVLYKHSISWYIYWFSFNLLWVFILTCCLHMFKMSFSNRHILRMHMHYVRSTNQDQI